MYSNALCSPSQPFPPYARAAIRNAIYDYWRDCGKRKNAFCSLDALLTVEDGSTYEPEFMLQKTDTLSPEQAVLLEESASYLKRLECAGMAEQSKENMRKCKIQGKYAETVEDIHKGTVGKEDEVSFVVTHIDEERNVAVGLISRIIRQNI